MMGEYTMDEKGYRRWLEEQAKKFGMTVEELERDFDYDQLYNGYYKSEHPQPKKDIVWEEDLTKEEHTKYRAWLEEKAEELDISVDRLEEDFNFSELYTGYQSQQKNKSKGIEKKEKTDSQHSKLQYHENGFDNDFRNLVDDAGIGYREIRDGSKIIATLQQRDLEELAELSKERAEKEQRLLREETERRERESIDWDF